MNDIDVQMISRALLTNDAQRQMFHTSATFRAGIEQIAVVALSAVIGLQIHAATVDQSIEQRIHAAEMRP